ncbi:MAG: nuclear transport factor 2 family protein [Thermoleophilia bacterium]|nr:nuclear transport factor 2 family protein [Thermoleophilia bacterium]
MSGELALTPIEAQVLTANRAFYDAFEALDLEAMEDCWEHTGRSSCVHPGGPWLVGWDEVRHAWEAILDGTRYIEFRIRDARVRVADPMAWVTCVEVVTSAGPGGRSVTELTATNLFVLGPDGWRLVLHHAAPMLNRAPREFADPSEG